MIYLDYVSTTPLNQEVNHMYQSLLNDYFANADSLYSLGLKTSALMEKSRELTAQLLHVLPEEIIFTSGASESNSAAIKGCAFQYQNRTQGTHRRGPTVSGRCPRETAITVSTGSGKRIEVTGMRGWRPAGLPQRPRVLG